MQINIKNQTANQTFAEPEILSLPSKQAVLRNSGQRFSSSSITILIMILFQCPFLQSTDSLPQAPWGAGAQQVRGAGAQHARGAGAQHARGAGAAHSPAAATTPRSSARKSTGDEMEDDQDQPLFPKNSKKKGHKAR